MPTLAIVWSSDQPTVYVPESMGDPRPDQMLGSPLDQVSELAGRVCYDSMGTGRSSTDWHQHIAAVNHLSVYRHAHATFQLTINRDLIAPTLLAFQGRPGAYLTEFRLNQGTDWLLRFAINLQATREWFRHTVLGGWHPQRIANEIGFGILHAMKPLAPLSLGDLHADQVNPFLVPIRVAAETPEETWASLYISRVSRGLCYHPSTEVLTADGWVKVGDLKVGQKILTKNPTTKLCRWSPNLKNHAYAFSGKLFAFSTSQMTSPPVTPDHLTWCARHDLRRARHLSCETNVFRFANKYPAESIYGKNIVIDHDITMETVLDPEVMVIGDHTYNAEDFFAWLGWVLTDGSISNDRNSIKIIQSKEHNLPTIRSLMNRLFGQRWRERSARQGYSVFCVHDRYIKAFLVSNFGRTKKERSLIHLVNYSRRLLRKFLSSAIAGDGNIHAKSKHEVIYCGYAKLAKGYQAICAAIGRSCNIRTIARLGQHHSILGQPTTWTDNEYVVSVHTKAASLIRSSKHTTEDYKGFVYCPQTEDGLIFVRYKGMAFWSGNSHELVRHSWMCAPSQRSTRYCDEDESEWVVHPEVRADPTVASYYGAAKEVADRAYREVRDRTMQRLLQAGADRLTARKQARGAARGVLGNALATELIFSASLAQWARIFQQRCHPAADAEIREAMEIARDLLCERFPNMVDVLHNRA